MTFPQICILIALLVVFAIIVVDGSIEQH